MVLLSIVSLYLFGWMWEENLQKCHDVAMRDFTIHLKVVKKKVLINILDCDLTVSHLLQFNAQIFHGMPTANTEAIRSLLMHNISSHRLCHFSGEFCRPHRKIRGRFVNLRWIHMFHEFLVVVLWCVLQIRDPSSTMRREKNFSK